MSCITPASFGGGQAVSASTSTGYGGSPSSTTIRYISPNGQFGKPRLSIDAPQQVGVTGAMRQMVPVKYSVDQSPGSNVMTVTFQDYLPLKFAREFVVLNDPDVQIPGGACVRPIGRVYHKPAGAPNRLDESTLRLGPAPKVKQGNSEKKLGQEYIYYKGNDLAAAAGAFIGGQLRGLVAAEGLMNDSGSLLSIVQSIASKNNVELYADSSGKIEVKPKAPAGGLNVGNGCNIVSLTSGKDITCTKAEGGFAIYKHEDQWRKEKKQTFKSLDLLGLPFEDCEKNMINLYKKDMDDLEKVHLERALKMGWLDSNWNNWEGFKTYVHLKRGAKDAEARPPDDKAKLINYAQLDKDNWGKSRPPRTAKKTCTEIGELPLKEFSGVKPNKTIDKIYHCLKPLAVRVDKAGLTHGIDMNFELNFKKGDSKSKIAKIDPKKLDYMVVNGYEKLKCEENDVVKDGYIADETKLENEVVPGSQGQFSAILSALAVTVGRYYYMSGGGAGGGAGTIEQHQHQLRNYADQGGAFNWYHPKLDVRETVFRDIYLSLYGQFIKNANKEGGVIVGHKDNGDPIKKEAKHLSVSQFLHLASKEKAFAMAGKDPSLNKAFADGNGQKGKELEAAAAANAQKCNNNMPKGIVIWDRQFDEISLPEQVEVFKMIGAGIESHNDRFSNDVLRWFFEQLSSSVIVNPCKKDESPDGEDEEENEEEEEDEEEAEGGEGGGGEDPADPVDPADAPDAEDQEADCLDGAVDAFEPHDDWEVGANENKKLDYTILEDREYFASRAKYPPCQGAYNVSVNSEDLSGKVLWRKTDCFGNVLEWDKDFNEAGQVNAALQSKVNEMFSSELTPCSQTTVTTCGSGPANMPGGGATQDFNVEFNEDGSVNTTFTVSGSEAGITTNVVRNNAGNNQNNGRAGNLRGQAVNNSNDPVRAMRNPRTR